MKYTKPNSRPSTSKGAKSNNSSGKSSVKKQSKENHACNVQQPDNSVLRPSIETSVSGLRPAVKLFETGTPEMHQLMTYECEIIYECKVCRNLFRSLANFISHKRVYCPRKFSNLKSSPVVEDHTILVESEGLEERSALPSRITARQDLTSLVQSSVAKYYKEASDKAILRDGTRTDTTVHLQPIENTTSGLYQTVGNDDLLMKNRVSQLQEMITQAEKVTLGPDGRVVQARGEVQQNTRQEVQNPLDLSNEEEEEEEEVEEEEEEEHIVDDDCLVCTLCKTKFSTKKTLGYHMKTVHNTFRLSFVCPCCKNLFTNSWSVLRHLYKVHRKTPEQVRRLRAQIQKKQVPADKLIKKHSEVSKSNSMKRREENAQENRAWIGHFEENSEVQRCAGCGRRFERRAALVSHAQICHKRIALCNNFLPNPQRTSKEEKQPPAVPTVEAACKQHQQTPQNSPMAPSKPSTSEKKIGIQVRMNYCKNGSGGSSNSSVASKVRRSERHRSCEEESCDGRLTPLSVESRVKPTHLIFTEGCDENSVNTCLDSNITNNSFVSETDPAVITDSSKSTTQVNSVVKTVESKLKISRLEVISKQLREAVESELKVDCKGVGPALVNGHAGDPAEEESDESDSARVTLSAAVVDVPKKDSEDCISKCETKKKNEDSKSSNIECIRTRTSFRLSSNDNSASDSVQNIEEAEESESIKNIVSQTTEREKESLSTVSTNGKALDSNSNPTPSSVEEEEVDGDAEDQSESQRLNGSTESLSPSKEGVIRILTRFQLKSICKKDVEEGNERHVEPEDLNNEDGSSLKENLDSKALNPNWLQEKIKTYIHIKTMQCLVCHEKFKNMFHLKLHVANHFGWNRFKCLMRYCSFVTYTKMECAKHLIKMHLKPHEKHLALDYVGEVKKSSGNCKIAVLDGKKAFIKRKRTIEKDGAAVKQTAFKVSTGAEIKVMERESAKTQVEESMDGREDGKVEENGVDGKAEKNGVVEGNGCTDELKPKSKRRKTNSVGSNKEVPVPPVRKCSPDSTTEPVENVIPDGAQYQLEQPEVIEISDSDDEPTATRPTCKSSSRVHEVGGREMVRSSSVEVLLSPEITDAKSLDLLEETQGIKGKYMEDEDTQDTYMDSLSSASSSTTLDEFNIRKMVMEVIFGTQIAASTNTN